MTSAWFVLDVNPEQWAIGPLGVARKNNKIIPYVGRNSQLAAYQEAIQEAIKEYKPVMITSGVPILLEFYFWRNRADYVTPQARHHRKHEVDVTNLQKATEDALQGVLFKNDKDVVDVHSIMMDQGPDVVGKVVVYIELCDNPASYIKFPDSVQNHIDIIDNTLQSTVQLELNIHDDNPEELF